MYLEKKATFWKIFKRPNFKALLNQEKKHDHKISRLVYDYSMPNVSQKVVKLIHSYTDYINRVVWKKY